MKDNHSYVKPDKPGEEGVVLVLVISVVILLVGLIILYSSYSDKSQAEYLASIQNTTIDKIRQDYEALDQKTKSSSEPIPLGLYEIKGDVKSELKTPHGGNVTIYYIYDKIRLYEKEEENNQGHMVCEKNRQLLEGERKTTQFWLNDGTGSMAILPEKATFHGVIEVADEIKGESFRPQLGHSIKCRDEYIRYEESYLPVDKPITVIGTVYVKNEQLYMDKGESSDFIISANDREVMVNQLNASSGKWTWLGILLTIIGGVQLILVGVYYIQKKMSKKGHQR
ncbi:MAG: hypothetical protein IJU23_00005 [Proteobacteria bacterium]|nr:hypothetical protein [Pseudomonadota bacterium]